MRQCSSTTVSIRQHFVMWPAPKAQEKTYALRIARRSKVNCQPFRHIGRQVLVELEKPIIYCTALQLVKKGLAV